MKSSHLGHYTQSYRHLSSTLHERPKYTFTYNSTPRGQTVVVVYIWENNSTIYQSHIFRYYREIRRPVRKADNLPLSCTVVTKFGSLNFRELSGPFQACDRTALPLTKQPIEKCTLLSPGNSSWIRWDPWNARWEPLFWHQKTTVCQITTKPIHSSGLSDIHLNTTSHTFPATFRMHSFSLHPTDRILPTYVYSYRMYTKQLQLAIYLSSHRIWQPRHLCHISLKSFECPTSNLSASMLIQTVCCQCSVLPK